jgi:hypothetical protein
MPMFPPPQQAYDYQSGWGQGRPFPPQGGPMPSPPMPIPPQAAGGYGAPAPMPLPPPGPVAPPVPPASGYPPQFAQASPQVPDPALAASPPVIDQTQTANTTGGPTQPQPERANVGNQLYRMGKQAPPANPFGGMPTPPPVVPGGGAVDPFALLQGAAPPQAPPGPLQAQPSPPMGPLSPDKEQLGTAPHGRFQRLSRFMGHPVVPEPKPKKR